MATAAQVLANRENATHSTGPTSEEGKAKTSQNAVRHHLTGRGLIVPLGLESAFSDFERGLRTNFMPNTSVEEMIFKRILECGWNLERCRLAQATLFEQSSTVDPLLDDHLDAKFARIDKYARQFENSMYKAMRELSKLQTEAQYRHEIHPLTQEEMDDPDSFDQTPQSLSAICNFQQAVNNADRHKRQNRPNARRAAMNAIEQFVAPPQRHHSAAA